ncbi:anti-phage ZorAB system protein ZorA [Piscibacillus halophilus]|uniref:anti-phage ZorAB system protein ZorA n=1 Tax=Piscibacillus halophilus TaxID=571933 RepID=UPI0015883E15|nr:anti-phage ZorAB system protein ZorA [Piscibacillus halophilus]
MIDILVDFLENNREFFISNNYASMLINLFFFAIITVSIIYTVVIVKTNAFIRLLKEVEEDNIDKKIYSINEKVSKNKKILKWHKLKWSNYFHYYSENSQNEEFIPDPYEYFKREDLIHKVGYRKIIEALPAIFVSLGILGTFIGIYIGIQDLEGGSSTQIQTGINTLLEGMDVAFLSSIVGILSSLLFQFFDRTILYNKLVNSVDNLREKLDEVIPVESEGSLLQNLVKTQAEQMNDLKSFFTDEFMNRLTSGIADSFNETITPHLEQTQNTMQELVDKTTSQQNEGMEKMVDQFVESLNETTNNHMDNLVDAFGKSIKWQQVVQERMETLVEEMSNAAESQTNMAKETTGLTDELNQFTEKYSGYQENLFNLSTQLENTTSSFDTLMGRMDSVLESLGDRYTEVEEQLKERIEEMNKNIDMFKDQSEMLTQVQADIQSTASSLHGMTDQLASQSDSLKQQQELTNDWSVKTQSLLEDVVEHSQVQEQSTNYINDILTKIMEERERIENIRGSYEEVLERNVDDLKRYWESNSQSMSQSSEGIERLSNKLDSSIEVFAEQMYNGIQRTFDQFDQELRKSVEHLAYGVEGLHDVIESMDQEIREINGYISSLNNTVKQTSTSQS